MGTLCKVSVGRGKEPRMMKPSLVCAGVYDEPDAPYVRRPGPCSLARIRQTGVQHVLPIRPYRLGILLSPCWPEIITAVLLYDLFDHLYRLG